MKNLKNLVTEDIRPEDLDIDAAAVEVKPEIEAQAKQEPEEEVRYYPLLDGRYTAKEAERLLAEREANR